MEYLGIVRSSISVDLLPSARAALEVTNVCARAGLGLALTVAVDGKDRRSGTGTRVHGARPHCGAGATFGWGHLQNSLQSPDGGLQSLSSFCLQVSSLLGGLSPWGTV